MAVSIQEMLATYDEKVAAVALQVRTFLLTHLPNVVEEVDVPAKLIGYSYSKGYKGVVCVIFLSKKRVKLGFYKGSELPDPHGLLTGTGKVHRYVEITSTEILQSKPLLNLIGEAIAAYKVRNKN